MNFKSLNFIKLIISLFIFIIGINFIIKGSLILNKNNLNIESQINSSEMWKCLCLHCLKKHLNLIAKKI